jgi:hypothetical protein
MCTPVTPAVPYLLLGLQDVQWAVGNSRGARKLARTPHMNLKKKKKSYFYRATRKLFTKKKKKIKKIHKLNYNLMGYREITI